MGVFAVRVFYTIFIGVRVILFVLHGNVSAVASGFHERRPRVPVRGLV